jgi:hypothetical protein
MARAPGLWKLDEVPFAAEVKAKIIADMNEFSSKPRKYLCEVMLAVYKSVPSTEAELREVQDISFSEETKYEGGYRDINKGPYFKRKKGKKRG